MGGSGVQASTWECQAGCSPRRPTLLVASTFGITLLAEHAIAGQSRQERSPAKRRASIIGREKEVVAMGLQHWWRNRGRAGPSPPTASGGSSAVVVSRPASQVCTPPAPPHLRPRWLAQDDGWPAGSPGPCSDATAPRRPTSVPGRRTVAWLRCPPPVAPFPYGSLLRALQCLEQRWESPLHPPGCLLIGEGELQHGQVGVVLADQLDTHR
jgi:hypothetical protein